MPTERIAMRKVREILRLTYDAGLPSREVARLVGVGSTGVRVMLQRFRASKLDWPLPEGLADTALEPELYGVAATRGGQRDRPEPDWAAMNRELKRKHVTLQVLWDEYIELHPGGYRYVLAEWRRCKVGIDYHVEASKHFYSVPYRHARAQVEVRLTARTVEIFLKGERIASHMRGSGDGHHTTINDHMPSSHRRYGDWTVERLLDEAGRLGPSVRMLCEMILSDRPHPEQGYRSCLGIVRLARPYGAARVDVAVDDDPTAVAADNLHLTARRRN